MEKPSPIEIHPMDDENSRAIMQKIRSEKIKDESAIRAIIDNYKFSSPEAKEHITARMMDLLKMGAFDQPEPKTIHFESSDL